MLDLAELANHYGTDVEKYYRGIGQREMSIPSVDEDIVTIAATAAKRVLDRSGLEGVRTLLFATETGVDQSKAAGVYLHGLLDLPSNTRVVELKHACYSASAAIQFGMGLISQNPDEKVLVIASDIARYEHDSAGEPTQGNGAVAILLTANPTLIRFEPPTGVYTEDIMDFWRPNYLEHALVDGKYSISAYLTSVEKAWQDYQDRGGKSFAEFDRFVYHQPFTKMAVKAHKHLSKVVGAEQRDEQILAQVEDTLHYNRRVGNSYTASMYFGLISLLDAEPDLTEKRIGLLSYGSGSVAEFFVGIVQPGYRELLRAEENSALLDARRSITHAEYLRIYDYPYPKDGSTVVIEKESSSPFRLAEISEHQRIYQRSE